MAVRSAAIKGCLDHTAAATYCMAAASRGRRGSLSGSTTYSCRWDDSEEPRVGAPRLLPRRLSNQRSHLAYMGGVMPSRPTHATVASHVPSAFFSHLGMKILAPGF